MRIINDIKLDFDDVLICPKRSKMKSRSDIDLVRTLKMLNSPLKTTGINIIASNMDSTGTFSMCEALSKFEIFTCLHKFYSEVDLVNFFNNNTASAYAFYTLGITETDISKLKSVKSQCQIDKICIDAANGYTVFFQDRVKMIREICPDAIIMAGNVVTPEMVQELLISGAADIVKIGIGPGSACETRVVTGCGYPQLSACLECADVAHGLGGLICSDGGCRNPGDIVKAFAAGSDFVMVGGMFAGHDECNGEWEEEIDSNGNKIKKSMKFYGMSSTQAMEKYAGGVASYRASEGKCFNVPYKGSISQTVQQILGGLRSACSYVGAAKLKHLSKCTTFVRINR